MHWAAPGLAEANGEKILSQQGANGEGSKSAGCCKSSSSSATAVANAAVLPAL